VDSQPGQPVPESIDDLSADVARALPGRPRLARMFRGCFRNALETTVRRLPDGTAFVVTGDIPAMWLRDSAAQVRPYLVVAAGDPGIADLLEAVVRRQLAFVRLDPYANAYNARPGPPGDRRDRPVPHPQVWERKHEVDSLSWPLLLAHDLWRATGRTGHLGQGFADAAAMILATWRTEQDHERRSAYRFLRSGTPSIDTLGRDGRGPLVVPTGMSWSGFRPSDDACTHGYHLPGNMLATVALAAMAAMAEATGRTRLAAEAAALRAEILSGIADHGCVEHPDHGAVWAYEVDGRGGVLLADDANLPSLLALPYLGWCTADDPVYRATRGLVLSEANPWFARGTVAAGIGSPHTPQGWVWPLGLITEALTSPDAGDRDHLLDVLERTDAGTGLMHESFDPSDPRRFTRPWFGWANALLAELVLVHTGLGGPLATLRPVT
jgi:meiotically up-regulated gene 157 (Mug157) protein